jgi:micrococcal nuclease
VGPAQGRRATGRPAPRPAARPPRWLAPPPPDVPAVRPAARPRGFLIYLIDGGEPIVVSRYVEEHGQIVFDKYGGSVRIPTYEIFKIVPDTAHPADRTANLPSAPVLADTGGAPLQPESDLYVTMRGGNDLRVASLTPEGDRVRVAVSNGSFTVPRSEIVSVVRVPPDSEVPEAWLSVVVTDAEDRAATGAAPLPGAPDPRVPYQSSDRPHFLRLANGQLMRVEGFWVEDGEFRFRRFGGIIGVAMNEVMRLFPEEIAPVRGRTPVRFVQRVESDLLEVSVRSGHRRVRLVGVEPVGGTWTAESPWRQLEPGSIIYLEFDRQRYDADGNWLAYVFLPNGRMLNAELIRLGLARPVGDGRNARYLDLLHEMSASPPAPAEGADPPAEGEAEQ